MLLASLIAVLVFAYLLSSSRSSEAIRRGRAGEAKVSAALRRQLPGDSYFVVDDIVLSDSLGKTQIDHVVVSRFGVFVVETKNYSGWVFGRERDSTWTHVFHRRKFKFQNPLRQNYRHVKAVQNHLDIPEKLIHSLVLFVGSAKLKTQMPSNVTSLSGGIRYINSFSTPVIEDSSLALMESSLESEEPIRYSAVRRSADRTDLRHSESVLAINSLSPEWSSGDSVVPFPIARESKSASRKVLLFIVAIPLFGWLTGYLNFTPGAPAGLKQQSAVLPSASEALAPSASRPLPRLKVPNVPPLESVVITGRATRLVSGDTFKFEDRGKTKYRVRLHGIDAPERWQSYSWRAKRRLKKLLKNQVIRIEVFDFTETGELVGVAHVGDLNVNLDMICTGYAWWDEASVPEGDEHSACQREAKISSLGLWRGSDPIPPWEYRKKN